MKSKRIIVKFLVSIVYLWALLWYDKRYLKGIYFKRDHFSKGWIWVIKYWFPQKVLGYGRNVPYPIPRNISIGVPDNLFFDVDDISQIHSPNCYFQGIDGKIVFGKGIKIAPNCGFITANHDFKDLTISQPGKDIVIGNNCWIGMNSVILPGIQLGNHTIVGAGSVVTKSFPEGDCIIAGNPAKIIRRLK